MANRNVVCLDGRMTNDIEIRHTASNQAVGNFGLAINRIWYNQEREKQEETVFVDVTVWGRQAEIVQKYAGKGRAIGVDGRLSLDEWQDREGVTRKKLYVTAERIHLHGSRDEDAREQRQSEEGLSDL